jgi:hypothetical protein
MLFTRLNDAGTGFEPERGNVYVFWHALVPGSEGEQNRRVWQVRSTDDGGHLSPNA